jgi:hypothetical protein
MLPHLAIVLLLSILPLHEEAANRLSFVRLVEHLDRVLDDEDDDDAQALGGVPGASS